MIMFVLLILILLLMIGFAFSLGWVGALFVIFDLVVGVLIVKKLLS